MVWGYQRDAAYRAVRRLIGAQGVTNSILVKPQEKPDVEDAAVAAAIKAAFLRSAILDSKQIHVEIHDGTVTLSGCVRSHEEREAAERATWTMAGVSNVENQLKIVPWGETENPRVKKVS